MSLGRRTGNLPLAPPKPVPVRSNYQDFQPKSEWKDEKEALIIVVFLPGFLKEQIRLTRDAFSRSIRVNGERPLLGNRFIRFNVAYTIPKNCNFNMIRTQFVRGILTITIPKNIASQPVVGDGPPEEDVILATPQHEKQPPPSRSSPPPDYQITAPSGLISEPKKSELPPSSTTAKEALNISAAIVDDRQKAKAKADGESEVGEEKGKEPAMAESGVSKGEEKEEQKGPEIEVLKREEKGKTAERMAAGGVEDEGKDKNSKGKDLEAITRKAENLEDSIISTEKLSKDPGKEMGLKEDKGQLAVNVAVAVLVIMAFGAYLSHKSFGSSEN